MTLRDSLLSHANFCQAVGDDIFNDQFSVMLWLRGHWENTTLITTRKSNFSFKMWINNFILNEKLSNVLANTTHKNYMCLFPVYLKVNFEIDYGPSIFHGGFWIFLQVWCYFPWWLETYLLRKLVSFNFVCPERK